MKSLEESRKRIDEIDKELVRLFEERMNTVVDVARYKKENNIEVLNTSREAQVVENAINNLENKEYSEEVADFFNHIMDISKNFQRKAIADKAISVIKDKYTIDLVETANKVGYIDKINHFSVEAIKLYYNKDIEIIKYDDYEEILNDVSNGNLDYAFLALDHAGEGRVSKMYSLLETYDDIFIKDKFIIDDELNIVNKKKSAKTDNLNRFVILGKDKYFCKDCNEVDLLVKIDNQSKSLSHLIRYFANYNIHINKIDSKKSNVYTKEFTIYINFDGSLQDTNVLKMLYGLDGDLPYIRIV